MPADLSIMERVKGRRTRDIALPNDTGEIDDRILEHRATKSRNPLARMGARMKQGQQKMKRVSRR